MRSPATTGSTAPQPRCRRPPSAARPTPPRRPSGGSARRGRCSWWRPGRGCPSPGRRGARGREGCGVAALPELPPATSVLGLVARLQPWKGQDRLVRAAALLRERGHAVHVLLVGGDSWELAPAYAEALPRLIAELGMQEHVTMTGEVPDAGPYIDRMDILVNASDPEPFGIVLLEGMARGVAVVAVDRGRPEGDRRGRRHRRARPQRASRPRSPTRSSRCWPRRSGGPSWQPPGASASGPSSPRTRCAAASRSRCACWWPPAGPRGTARTWPSRPDPSRRPLATRARPRAPARSRSWPTTSARWGGWSGSSRS